MRTRQPPPGLAVTATLAVLAASGVLLTGPAAAPASAQEEGEPAPQVELILDSSGSMNENDAGGQTRMAAAKDAMHGLIDDVPDEAEVGLRFYGHTYPGENETKGCRDTELVLPIGALDADAAHDAIDELEPTGFTPIGHALEQAGEDFSGDGARRIILVSDGEDTCAPPDPCEVAADLADQGIDLAIDTVGFNVDGKARSQLQCIAEATGGQYGDASDADELADQLNSMVKRAVQDYDAYGQPVRGSRQDCQDAPVLEEGQYLDHLSYKEDVWYQLRVRPGQALRVSFTSVLNGSVGRTSTVATELSLPGRGEFEDSLTLRDSTVLTGWANQVTVGTETERFDWSKLDPGEPRTLVCAKFENGLQGDQTFPTEIQVEFLGEPLTYADLPKSERSEVTRVASPNDEPESDDAEASGQRDEDRGSDADGADTGEERSSDPRDGLALLGSDGGPNVVLTAVLAVLGLILGAVVGNGIARKRRTR